MATKELNTKWASISTKSFGTKPTSGELYALLASDKDLIKEDQNQWGNPTIYNTYYILAKRP